VHRAADFYYGEMEIRRHAGRPIDTNTDNPTGEASRGQVERAILTAYWPSLATVCGPGGR
jgi:hypothetical protein